MSDDTTKPNADAVERLLVLAPQAGNSRNSEGDLIRLDDGRLLLVWTRFSDGDGGDHDPASICLIESRDDGATWSAPRVVAKANDGMNVMSASLRVIDGKFALFYLRKRSLLDCQPVVSFSSDDGETFGAPIEIVQPNDVGYDVLNNDRVLVLKDGTLLVPVARHAGVGVGEKFNAQGRLRCYRSKDGGQSWHAGAWAPSPEPTCALQEPGLFVATDGAVMMFGRTDHGAQFISRSNDGGQTFSVPKPWTLRSPLSPATIQRLSDSSLLAIWNEPPAGHNAAKSPRTPLVAARSGDDGKTWGPRLMLLGHPDGWYCYTAVLEDERGMYFATCAGNQATGNGLNTMAVYRSRFPEMVRDP